MFQEIQTIVLNINKTITTKSINAILKEEIDYTFNSYLFKNDQLQNFSHNIKDRKHHFFYFPLKLCWFKRN